MEFFLNYPMKYFALTLSLRLVKKTDTILKYFFKNLHTCHTVNNRVIALKFADGFVHGLIFLGGKTELI